MMNNTAIKTVYVISGVPSPLRVEVTSYTPTGAGCWGGRPDDWVQGDPSEGTFEVFDALTGEPVECDDETLNRVWDRVEESFTIDAYGWA